MTTGSAPAEAPSTAAASAVEAAPAPPHRDRGAHPPGSTPSPMRRYGVAVLASAAATLITLVLGDFMQQNLFVFFPFAVLVGVLYGGPGPGVLVIFLNAAIIEALLAPPGTLVLTSIIDLLHLGILVLAMTVVAVLADMLRTSQRRSAAREEALRESEERFRELTEHSREVFWLISADLRQVLYVSPAVEEVFGHSPETLYANPRLWLKGLHPEDRQRMLAILAAAPGGGELEYRVVRPDGGIRWIRNRAFPIRGEDGRVRRIAGVAEDVTDRRELEEQFRRSQKLEALGRLAGDITHDFNNTLAVIIGYGQVLLNQLEPDDPRRKYVENTLAAAGKATSLADQLLAFSRKKTVQPELLDLNSIIGGMDAILRRLLGEHLELRVMLGPAVGYVRADPGHIEQVLMNLAVNARDAMPDGGRLQITTHAVTLTERQARRHSIAAGPYVAIAVTDTGCGMDANVVARIFEPFFTTKAPGKGTGLGLSIVYGIVRQNGGGIHVRSAPGSGTTITLYLPRSDSNATADSWDQEPPEAPHGPSTMRPAPDDRSSSESTAAP